MLSAIKSFFISVLITVGIVSSPVPPPAQEIINPEPQIIVQDQEVKQVIEEPQITPKPVQNTPKLPVEPTIVQKIEAITEEVSKPVIVEETLEQITIEKINGQCGGSANKKVTIKPSENLCSQGEASQVTQEDSSFTWKCLGSGGGKDSYSCSAPIITDGICGSLVNTIIPQNYDKNNLCLAGLYTNPQTIGNQLQWTCSGEYGGQNTACYATKVLTQNDIQQQNQSTQQTQTPLINGSCGYAQNQTYSQPPTTGLCSAGTATIVTKSGSQYKWACQSSGAPAQCSATYKEQVCIPTSVFIFGQGMVTVPCPSN